MRLVIRESPGAKFVVGAGIPDDLVCRAEEVTPYGRFDLSVPLAVWDLRLVVVELKIHEAFAPNQIER